MQAHLLFLTQNCLGTYYFRIVIPKHLRSAFGLQREIRRTLKTDSTRLALRRARQYAASFEAAFEKVLVVAERDDYEPTDEDYEFYLSEIEKAEAHGPWASHSSVTQKQQSPQSILSDDEWSEIETEQRQYLITKALTGHGARTIPANMARLAEQLRAQGNTLPLPHFKRLLPTLIERIALRAVEGADTSTPTNNVLAKTDGPTLYELWELHWDALARLAKSNRKSERTKEDEHGHAFRLNILSGKNPVNLLTLEDFERIYLQIFDIRVSRGAKLPSPDSPSEAILAKDGESRIGAGTVEKLIIRLGALHSFALKKGMAIISPDLPDKPPVDHSPAGGKIVEKAFSQGDLQAIFSGYLYTGTELHKSNAVFPYQFWLPVLGLFTGVRLNELCQLDTEDICKTGPDGIWTISMMDDDLDRPLPKSLKNISSRRTLPIHSELLRMGFLDFVADALKQGREKLFSDGLTYNPKKGWGSNATHFFCRSPSPSTPAEGYFHKCGIRQRGADGKTDRKNFHSFRHTFTDLARQSGAEAYLALPDIAGHSRSGEGTVARYGNGFSQEKKQAVLEGLRIPVDLSGISYENFRSRLGRFIDTSVDCHREKFGLNQRETTALAVPAKNGPKN
ncbi:site-specific integrase [Pseudomonas syringae]|uniref:site-specific integrase n=1 Tax=Pseudomonas syringae TaxID=317 RepID=UPI001F0E89BB|nr:site-specific integrase [Pseudomonas syringae]MCH5522380.1 site-specific integrase [Pseudomonas syringae pv. lapsa]